MKSREKACSLRESTSLSKKMDLRRTRQSTSSSSVAFAKTLSFIRLSASIVKIGSATHAGSIRSTKANSTTGVPNVLKISKKQGNCTSLFWRVYSVSNLNVTFVTRTRYSTTKTSSSTSLSASSTEVRRKTARWWSSRR